MTKTQYELRKTCGSIYDELVKLYSGNLPEQELKWREDNGYAYDLPTFFDEARDYEITINSRGEVMGVTVYLTIGGPNVWIDTRECRIEGRWGCDEWGKRLPPEICEEIDEIFKETYTYTLAS